MNYARIAEIAGRLESYAVIGAYALAAHGYIRQTADLELRVPRMSDLIVLKVDAGGYLDTRDAIELLRLAPRGEIVDELRATMPTLPEPLRRSLTDFLQNNSSIA